MFRGITAVGIGAREVQKPRPHLFSRRENNIEGGAFVRLGFDMNHPAMFEDDPAGDGKPQSGAVGFGGKKRFEDAAKILRVDPRS